MDLDRIRPAARDALGALNLGLGELDFHVVNQARQAIDSLVHNLNELGIQRDRTADRRQAFQVAASRSARTLARLVSSDCALDYAIAQTRQDAEIPLTKRRFGADGAILVDTLRGILEGVNQIWPTWSTDGQRAGDIDFLNAVDRLFWRMGDEIEAGVLTLDDPPVQQVDFVISLGLTG